MADGLNVVTDLVLAPFKETVEKGKTAIGNAAVAEEMLKTSQKLVRDAERTVKRIEPLCSRLLDEYGSNFIDALKESDELAEYRSQLNHLLWDFDDYVEPEEFDKEKFLELQALVKKSGLRTEEILKRMKLEPVPKESFPTSPVTTRVSIAEEAHTHMPNSDSPHSGPPLLTAPVPVKLASSLMDSRSGPDEGLEPMYPPIPSPDTPAGPLVEENSQEPPPPPPSINPWDLERIPSLDATATTAEAGSVGRRAPISSLDSPVELESPSSPTRRLEVDSGKMAADDGERAHMAVSPDDAAGLHDRAWHSTAQTDRSSIASRARASSTTLGTSIPENLALDSSGGDDRRALPSLAGHRYSQASSNHSYPSRQRSRESMQSSVFEGRQADGTKSPAMNGKRSSAASIPDYPTNTPVWNAPLNTTSGAPTMPQDLLRHHHSGLEVVPPAQHDTEGLIPVESETSVELSSPMTTRQGEPDCSIGLGSSFYLYKGFCEGAKDVLRGGIGVKKTKKPGFAGTNVVAKCSSCFYELEFRQVELDINKSESGNFTTHGIGFRIRFLQKSHIATKRSDEQLYGCLFCVQNQRTMEQCDSSVFFSQKKLFEHLARHPRPLPAVPGLTVVEEAEVPFNLTNNYDLHFKLPVEPSPLADRRLEIAQLPTATSKETAKRMYGMRLLPDRTPGLEMAVGAKISGIVFPSKYEGDWCMGWHDGVYASCPVEILKFDPPPQSEIRMGGTSNIHAQARWKFSPKEKDGCDWLKFDKGDIISNISWAYQDHWCWSGTNKKGKWGIFPQAFIDTNTLKELSISSDRASVSSADRRRSEGMLSRFSIRKGNSGRPPSVMESSNIQEVTPPTAPRPRGYY